VADTNTLRNTGIRPFFRSYPVLPVYKGTKNLLKTAPSETDLLSVAKLLRVQFADIKQSTENDLTFYCKMFSHNALGLPNFVEGWMHKMYIYNDDPLHLYKPLFYLPYANDQNRRITLEDRRPGAHAPVDLFVTDAVDGCSVYVEGTRANPTVYHINASKVSIPDPTDPSRKLSLEGGRGDLPIWQGKWASMDQRFRTEGTMAKTVQAGVNLEQATKLESSDYMIAEMGGAAYLEEQARQYAPRRVLGKKVKAVSVATKGTVFGELEAGVGWHFYIQRRVFVGYHEDPFVPGAPNPPILAGTWNVLDVAEFWPRLEAGRAV
jgi:hypothetical protein